MAGRMRVASFNETSMLRYAFGLMLGAIGLHTIWKAAGDRPLVIGYGHGHRITIASPK
jgi:hypothetical protein